MGLLFGLIAGYFVCLSCCGWGVVCDLVLDGLLVL